MDKHLHIVSKKSATEHGLDKYFTGKTCKNGHIDERTVSESRCIECVRDRSRKWWNKNKEELLAKRRADRAADPSKSREIVRKSYRKNKHKWKETRSRYAQENKDKMNEYYKQRMREWRKTPEGKATSAMRSSLARVMNGRKSKRSEDLLGYTRFDLIDHLERQFLKGMSWSNYGEWHIDHIVPVSHFIRNGEDNPRIINALTNLRPMWASDNLSKGASVETLL